ncbi:MFS transporter [Pseudomonas sp. BN605]|uniref:MFS transporter n=1 Tax=Pseudomonas hunanensis TaxID=1247546 RepID=A0ABD6MXE8_9PSED|nr:MULTISPECIES: MFS transporter [Pseudomonas]MDH4847948.1 MFS transporter [Pseudomonas sp. BN605]NWL45623.1 MFS transporter [Pseudomonas hunanensis]
MSIDLRASIDLRPMGGFQWVAVSICVFLNLIDGFDVLVMAFTATAVSSFWQLTGAQLGYLLGAGLLGMSIGSLFVAPWADKWGRRPLVLVCLTASGIGMLLSAASMTPIQLGITRVITGIGIGGILACSNVVASEYASTRWRSLALSLQSTGYAVGALFGGLFAIFLIEHYGWRSVFLIGGAATLTMIPVVYFLLPESMDFLITKQPRNALLKINKLAGKLNLQKLDQLPDRGDVASENKSSVRKLITREYMLKTAWLWAAFFLVLFGFYFVMNWTPKLLASAGQTAQQGITGGMLLSAGGIVGSALLGLLSTKFKTAHVQAAFLVITAITMVFFVNASGLPGYGVAVGLLLGITVNGCVAGLYAIAPTVYDASVRTTGVGFAIGVGRAGGILSPVVAGFLIDDGWQPGSLFTTYAVAFTIAALVILKMSYTGKAKHERMEAAADS